MKRYLIGYDIGSSSVKASLVSIADGTAVASAYYPKNEAPITAVRPGWAEQDPADWWNYLKAATAEVMATSGAAASDVAAIGISYQMHGLVCVDRDGRVLRPAIIWCDSRAVPYGEEAFRTLGSDCCLGHLLNSPGNFTASKLAWVKENEPDVFARIDKVMLPGDYIAMRLTGETCTTVGGLSEGMFWDFKENGVARFLLDHYGIPATFLPPVVPTFSEQGRTTTSAAAELGLVAGIPVTYRAGDQPNNALSLDVFEPGQIAATAGTSGVVYGVLGRVGYDPQSRVNTFAHVNHTAADPRLGVLLCINGTGCLNSWMRRTVAPDGASYSDMNAMADSVPVGCDGLTVLPFGNGAERVLGNRDVGSSIHGLNFNIHTKAHLLRAAQEGIVFAFKYGMEVMEGMGMDIHTIHAGHANMFLNPVFRHTLATVTGATIELYDTDGSVGAAKGAGMGLGIYADHHEAFATLRRKAVVEPCEADKAAVEAAYERWKELLNN